MLNARVAGLMAFVAGVMVVVVGCGSGSFTACLTQLARRRMAGWLNLKANLISPPFAGEANRWAFPCKTGRCDGNERPVKLRFVERVARSDTPSNKGGVVEG